MFRPMTRRWGPCLRSTQRYTVWGLTPRNRTASRTVSEDYRTQLEAHGITCNMSRRGNCYDNVVMEAGSRR